MKKTLAIVLTLAMVLSSVITFSVGATISTTPKPIVIDGVFDDAGWKDDGWTKVDETTGWYQSGPVAETEFEFEYQMKTDGTSLFIAAKFNQAPVWVETKQDGATNLRFWFDGDTSNIARTGLFDFTYDKSEGATAIIKETKNSTMATPAVPVADVACAATEGTDYLYVEASFKLASLGIVGDNVKFMFSGSQPGLLKTAAIPANTEVDPPVEAVPEVRGYCALHSVADVNATNTQYYADSSLWRDLDMTTILTDDVTLGNPTAYGVLSLNEGQIGITAKPVLTEGTEYTMTFNAKGTATLGTLFVNCYRYNTDGSLKDFADIIGIADETTFADWKEYSNDFTAGGGQTTVSITAWAPGGKNTGAVCVDDIVIREKETGNVVFSEDFEDGYHSCVWGTPIDEFSVVGTSFAPSVGAIDPNAYVYNAALGKDYVITMVRDQKVWTPKVVENATIATAWNDATPKTVETMNAWVDADGNLLTYTNANFPDALYTYSSDNSGGFSGKELTDGIGLDNPEAATTDNGNNFYNCNGHVTVDIDLGKVSNLCAFYAGIVYNTSWGMKPGNYVEFWVSEDGEEYEKVTGTIHNTDPGATVLDASNGWDGHIFGVKLDHNVAGRYVKVELDAPAYVFTTEIEVYANEEPEKVYVNAVTDPEKNGTNNSLAGLGNEGEFGGAQNIIYFEEAGTYTCQDWRAVLYFKPTDNVGEYELYAIAKHGDAYAPIDVPAGGFVFDSNVGNNWKDLSAPYWAYLDAKAAFDAGEGDEPEAMDAPWWWGTYENHPNEITVQGTANYDNIRNGKYAVGDLAYLYNINLELLTCSRDYNSYIAIGHKSVSEANNYNEGALVIAPIDTTTHKVGETNIALNAAYQHLVQPNAGYADTDAKELTDGIKDVTNSYSDASWTGFSGVSKVLSVVDLGEVKSVAKFMAQYCDKGYGIGVPGSVSYYGSLDAENWYYIGDTTVNTTPIANNPDNKWAPFDLELTLDKTVDTRYVAIVSRKGANFSFVFISEFEAYSTEELPPPAESEPEESVPATSQAGEESGTTPETGDFTPIVLAVLAMILAASVVLVIKRRRA